MKFLQLFIAIPLLTVIATQYGHAQTGDDDEDTGNNQECGVTNNPVCTPTGEDLFVAYTGNVYREVRDLQVWGSVGEIPLEWVRYGCSRTANFKHLLGTAHNWNHSFEYDMLDASSQQGPPQIEIIFPEGGDIFFTRDLSDTTIWLPPPAIDKRLLQNGTTFTLQDAKGYRYDFQKLTKNSGGTHYLLEDIRDNNDNKYILEYNGANNLTQVTEPAGRYIQIQYGKAGDDNVITQVTTSDGRSVNYSYTVYDDGITKWSELTTVTYGDSTKAVYEYSQTTPGIRPHVSHATDPRTTGVAVNMKYTYDADVEGEVTQEINGTNDSLMVTLDTHTANRKVCYSNGRMQKLNMPSPQMGRVNTYTDGLGRKTSYSYADGGTGFLKSFTDPLQHTTTYDSVTVYDNPIQITYADGSFVKWTRDDLDLELTYTDELGRVKITHRDTSHHISSMIYPDNTIDSFTYNHFGEILTHTLRNGGIEYFNYDSRGLKTSFIDAVSDTTTYTYDNADRLASMTDARKNTTMYIYNERGLMTRMTNPDGSAKRFGYDAFGNKTSDTDELGHVWSIVYDEFKRPVSKTDPLIRTTLYSYDLPNGTCGCRNDNNKPTKITLPSGRISEIGYDVEWEKTSETVGAGTADAATTAYEYDAAGNLHITTDPNQDDWTNEYDQRNRRISFKDPLGHETQWTYDAVGNNLTIVRPDSGITINVYDNMNRDTLTTDPKGGITKFKYDKEDNVTKLIDAKNHVYKFAYDLLNRKTSMTYPGSTLSQESYTYDPVGNLKTFTNRNGKIRTYEYDNRNRETSSSWDDNSTPSISRNYDFAGRLDTIVSKVSTLTYGYDDANELTSEKQNVKGNSAKTIGYKPNADGLPGTMTYPDGSVMSYDYTGRNQLASISVNGASPLVKYFYDPNGNRISKVLENGTTTSYGWDAVNRDTLIDNQNSSGSFAKFVYGYDNMNRRQFVKRDDAKGDVFFYDAIDQVDSVAYDVKKPGSKATDPDRTVDYDYDAVGNRMTLTNNGVATAYNENNLNQYTSVGTNSLTYTNDGALKSYNDWNYTYDAQDRLIKATNGSTIVSFKYDSRNRCVQRTINGTITYFYYDNWNLIDERDASNAKLALYINGAMTDEILSKTSSGTTVYYHHDALGNVVRLTGNGGGVAEQYSYDVFGAPTIKDNNGNIISLSGYGNRFTFAGREYIPEIGLYDYRNRIFSQNLGRFLQADPLRFGGRDENLYRYVGNSPLNHRDPTGYIFGLDDAAVALLALTAAAIGALATTAYCQIKESKFNIRCDNLDKNKCPGCPINCCHTLTETFSCAIYSHTRSCGGDCLK